MAEAPRAIKITCDSVEICRLVIALSQSSRLLQTVTDFLEGATPPS
jgi:hypothetical protein